MYGGGKGGEGVEETSGNENTEISLILWRKAREVKGT